MINKSKGQQSIFTMAISILLAITLSLPIQSIASITTVKAAEVGAYAGASAGAAAGAAAGAGSITDINGGEDGTNASGKGVISSSSGSNTAFKPDLTPTPDNPINTDKVQNTETEKQYAFIEKNRISIQYLLNTV